MIKQLFMLAVLGLVIYMLWLLFSIAPVEVLIFVGVLLTILIIYWGVKADEGSTE
jgi:hypothetical protein